MARSSAKVMPTHYQILQVHPTAPLELITCAYWRLVSMAQGDGISEKASEIAVYHLTRSYQVLANPAARADYDLYLGIAPLPLRPHVSPVRTSPWISPTGRPRPEDDSSDDTAHDYYSLLRLDPLANPAIVAESYMIMRNYYLRLVEQMQARPQLLALFEEAHDVISDPKRRRLYDQARKKRQTLLLSPGAPNANGKSPAANRARGRRSTATPAVIEEPPEVATTAVVAKSPRPRKAAEPAILVRSARNGTFHPQVPGAPTGADAPAAPMEFVRSLAANSAAALRMGGKGSINLARKASQTLRDVLLDVEPLEEDGLTAEEERVLLGRLSSVPEAPAPVRTKPPVYQNGLLARLTVTGGPGLGTAFDVDAVPFTLGEDEGCDIALPGLASEQARLLHRDGQFVLFSLTDEPKTSVHGDTIAWAVLQDGDSFEIGPYRLRFESPSVSATPA